MRGRSWCLFTSAGDHNAIGLWLQGGSTRRWDLVAAYYGDDPAQFARIEHASDHAFRSKGGKFQNLRKLVLQSPRFFERYSHVWVSRAPHCDFRMVNFVEVGVPLFRRDKLMEFLAVYDGSLTGWGIDYWYASVLQANARRNFAIIDRVQVVNPHDEEKGGREIDRLQTMDERRIAWESLRERLGVIEHPHQVFAECHLPGNRLAGALRRVIRRATAGIGAMKRKAPSV